MPASSVLIEPVDIYLFKFPDKPCKNRGSALASSSAVMFEILNSDVAAAVSSL